MAMTFTVEEKNMDRSVRMFSLGIALTCAAGVVISIITKNFLASIWAGCAMFGALSNYELRKTVDVQHRTIDLQRQTIEMNEAWLLRTKEENNAD